MKRQPNPTVTTKSFHYQDYISWNNASDEDESPTVSSTTQATESQSNPSNTAIINHTKQSQSNGIEEESQTNLFTIENRIYETQSEAEDRILAETSADIAYFKQSIASSDENENTVMEDSQLTDLEEEIGLPTANSKDVNSRAPLLTRNTKPNNRSVTRSQQELGKKNGTKKLTEEEEEQLDIYASYEKDNKLKRKRK